MYKIKFGTDGWRDIIGEHFTNTNVKRVAYATSVWLKNSDLPNKIVIGHDCRFAGSMFAQQAASIFATHEIDVVFATDFVSTPMISLAANKLNAGLGIIITASHNPPSYSGFKIKANYGGPATPSTIDEIEALIPDLEIEPTQNFEFYVETGRVVYADLETMYAEHCQQHFDMDALRSVGKNLLYDAMYGAGRGILKRLLPEAELLHAGQNPGFEGRAPEPILKNLPEMAQIISQNDHLHFGLATDGDADRIGFFDEFGNFIDSHHLILLLIEYLTEYKGFTGKVVKSFSVSDKISKLCELKGIETITTKIGFKYICEIMVTDDVLIGAEESGGIAIKGHIPERDGIWMGLVLMEYAAKSGKTISQLISDIYKKIGSFAVERYDLHLDNNLKLNIVENCKSNSYANFGSYQIVKTESIDGYKFHLENGSWVMIRPSGTEPVLRVYAESNNSEEAFKILNATKAHILN